MKPFCPHSPSSKQRYFLELDCREVFYGGAAGGGKSDALIMGALQYIDVPGYRAILFRKTQKDLERDDAIKARADSWFRGTTAKWDAGMYAWRFPTMNQDGTPGIDATISFGYLERLSDRTRYQGPGYQYIGVDEAVQWRIADYKWLFSRLRKTREVGHVPLRLRSSGNPGGLGHDEFKARYIAHSKHETGITYADYLAMRRRREELPEPPYFTSPPTPEEEALAKELGVRAEGAVFVPAYSEDNPGLDSASYRMNLAQLDQVERKQLDEGDWDVAASGRYFKPSDFRYVDADEVPKVARRCRYWDFAGTDPEKARKRNKDPDWSAGAKCALVQHPDAAIDFYVEDVERFRKEPAEIEPLVKAVAQRDGRRIPVFVEEEPGASGKANTSNYAGRVLVGWVVTGHKKTGNKESFWKPLASLARVGRVHLVRAHWNAAFVKELCDLPDGPHDDSADAAAGAFDRLLEDDGATMSRFLAQMT